MDPTWNAAEDDEEELEEELLLQSTKDTILFCIDAAPSMHRPQPQSDNRVFGTGKSHVHQAMQAVADVMRRKVIVGPNDSIGVLFFNTEEKLGEDVGANHYLYRPVSQIDADSIKSVLDFVADIDEDPGILEKILKPKEDGYVALGDVFASCNHVLRIGAPKTSIKRIFFITDEDNPESLQGPAMKRLEDLVAQGIKFDPFFINTKEKPFDITKFYSAVLAGEDQNAGTPSPFANVCEGFEQVLAELRIREAPKRSLWSIPMTFGKDFTIGVKGYGLISEHKKPLYKYVSAGGRTTEEVASKTIYMEKDQHNSVDPTKLLYGLPFDGETEAMRLAAAEDRDRDPSTSKAAGDNKPLLGNSRETSMRKMALFTAEQLRLFKTFGITPTIKILGFKDSSELQYEDNVKHAYFIYPDESAYTGSIRTFSSLHKSLLKKDKIGLALVVMRRNSSPVFCAMVPQKESFDKHGSQSEPPGFHLIPLPFVDEIRNPPIKALARPTEADTTNAIIDLIGKLTLKDGYQSDAYPNPALARHYGLLESLALGTEFEPEEIPDTTVPNYDRIHNKTNEIIQRWKIALDNDPEALKVDISTSGTKRRAPLNIDEHEIRSNFEDRKYGKITIPMIKAFLIAKGEKPRGTLKTDLMEQLGQYFDSH